MNKFGALLLIASFCIVVGIVIYLTNPLKGIQDKNDTKRVNDLTSLSLALEKYHNDNGRYPASTQSYTIMDNEEVFNWGMSWLPYMTQLPKDPSIGRNYVYWSDPRDGYQSYRLYASLEDPTHNPNACSASNECSGVPAPHVCGGGALCNFGITSNNISP